MKFLVVLELEFGAKRLAANVAWEGTTLVVHLALVFVELVSEVEALAAYVTKEARNFEVDAAHVNVECIAELEALFTDVTLVPDLTVMLNVVIAQAATNGEADVAQVAAELFDGVVSAHVLLQRTTRLHSFAAYAADVRSFVAVSLLVCMPQTPRLKVFAAHRAREGLIGVELHVDS